MSPLLLRRLSDEQLGGRLASGEAAAFDELYRRYAHRLAAYGAHLLGDGAAGEDVSQSALLKAYGALRDGQVPERVKPWLYRIAHNTAIDLVVRRREVPSAELPERPTGGSEPAAGALVAALASLPDRQRRVYALREVHGLRIDETASELGLTAAQVEQALFAARNRLAEQLVFGDRLNCVSVQRLAGGPLDLDERRALKTHLRSCASCRGALGSRGRALGVFPGWSFDWLRGLFAGLAGGGAPVAAKVGAVVATAGIAAGVPVVAVEQQSHHVRPPAVHAAKPETAPPVPSSRLVLSLPHTPVVTVAGLSTAAAPVVRREGGSASHGEDGTGDRAGASGTARVEDGGDGGGDGVSATAARPAVATSGTPHDGGGSEGDRAATSTTEAQQTGDGGDRQQAAQAPLVQTTSESASSSDGSGGGGDSGGSGDGQASASSDG